MNLEYIEQAEVKGKRILARFDFNVPLKGKKITDTTRIDAAIPTIRDLLNREVGKIILMSHLGRPKGKKNPDLGLEPVAKYLAEKLNTEVVLTSSAIDSGVKQLLQLPESKIIMLENLRFHSGEEKNEHDFAAKLASYGQLYLNDAFGAAHRKHASTYGILHFFPNKAYAGPLIKKELEALGKITNQPARPFVAVLGGAKISDKIKTIERLLPLVNHILIGGAMAYPFLKYKGHQIGKSLFHEHDLALAERIFKQDQGGKIHLPSDHIMAISPNDSAEICNDPDIADNKMGLDIGPKTLEDYAKVLQSAQTIFWNGPMGLFENQAFANGTLKMAKYLANSQAYTLVGGGDSVSAVKLSGYADKISHLSTGGGASLEYIEQGDLPGIHGLKYGVS